MYNSLINVGVFMKRLFTILLLLSAVCFAGQYVLAGDPPPTGSGTGSSGTGSGSGNGGSNGGSNGGDSLVDITIGGNQTPGGGGFGGGRPRSMDERCVEAVYDMSAEQIEFMFNVYIGVVTVVVTNEMGYTVAAQTYDTEFIDVAYLSMPMQSGSYTVTISGEEYFGEGYFML